MGLQKKFEMTASAINVNPKFRFQVNYRAVQERCKKMVIMVKCEDACNLKQSGTDDEMTRAGRAPVVHCESYGRHVRDRKLGEEVDHESGDLQA